MADPIDDLEAMIAEALEAAEAGGFFPEVKASIQAWRERFGGDEIYIARRAHIRRHQRILELMAQGLTSNEITARVGVTRQTVHHIKKSSSVM